MLCVCVCSCVLLSQKNAEKLKHFMCPKCAKRLGQKYKYGEIPGFDHVS